MTCVDAWAQSETQAVPVVVDGKACLALVEPPGATTAPGVAYTPGVDVKGRPVVPAEGPGGGATDWLSDSITIDLTVPLADRLGGQEGGVRFDADARIGQLTVRNDGRVYLDGRPVTGGNLEDLREACRRLDAIRRGAATRKPVR